MPGKFTGMDPIAEGSHEKSVGSRKSQPSPQTVLLNEELEQLRREIELLRATKTRTQLAPSPEESPRTIQIREQVEQLRLENERMMASRMASPASALSPIPRTYQDVNRSVHQAEAEKRSVHVPSRTTQGDMHAARADHYEVPAYPKGVSAQVIEAGREANGSKYMIETPFAAKDVPSSRTSRTQSLPKPSAPPGASTRSLAPSRSVQVVGDVSPPKMEDRHLPGTLVTPSSPDLSPPSRTVQDSGERSKAMSPQTLQALGALQVLRQEREMLIASKTKTAPLPPPTKTAPLSPPTKTSPLSPPATAPTPMADEVQPAIVLSSNTRAQMNNNPKVPAAPVLAAPVPTAPVMSVRTLQALDEVAKVKRELELLKASKVASKVSSEVSSKLAKKVEPPTMSDRTRQVMNQLEKMKRENAMLKSSKAKEMESAQRRLAYFEQNHAAASKIRTLEIKKMVLTSQELDLAFLVDATGSMQVMSCTL